MTARALLIVTLVSLPGAVAPADAPTPPGPQSCEGPPAGPRAWLDRARWHDTPEYAALRTQAGRLGAFGAPIEEPCLPGASSSRSRCARPALASFFRALDATATRGSRTGVVVLGNSIIASDGVTSLVRARLQQRFGDGGRGLVLADRMASYGPRSRTAQRVKGWNVSTIAGEEPLAAPAGLTGVVHSSDGPARSVYELDGETVADVFWYATPEQPTLRWRTDDFRWHRLPPGPLGHRMARLTLPHHTSRFELASGSGAVLHGVSLERAQGGLVLDVVGVPSADAALWLTADEDAFSEQLAARAPRLTVLMLGGNETKRIGWGRATRASTDASLRQLVSRIREAAPRSACLVVGPLDAVQGPNDEIDPLRQRPHLVAVNGIERQVAFEHGCAFFDLYTAMGGRDAVRRFADAGLMHDDLVHPRQKGLDILGLLLSDALLDAWAKEEWLDSPPRTAAPARLARSH